MMAMEVLLILRCLSCCRVSWRAESPWLISAGRSAKFAWAVNSHGVDRYVSASRRLGNPTHTGLECLVILLQVGLRTLTSRSD